LKQPPKNSKSQRRPEFANPRDPAGRRGFVNPPTSGRKWLFRLVAMVVIPLVLLGGLEAALRLAGYDYRTSLFKEIQISEEKFGLALADYGRARQQRPQDPQTIFSMGKVLAKLNRHTEAIENYRAAIRLNPANWEAHFELGGELDSANQLATARNEFGEAARLNPGNARTHFNYGVLLVKQEQLDEAQREFEETIRLEPDYKMAQTYLAQLRAMKKRTP
jgi:tetratricopeptide (TPR) repeat protein